MTAREVHRTVDLPPDVGSRPTRTHPRFDRQAVPTARDAADLLHLHPGIAEAARHLLGAEIDRLSARAAARLGGEGRKQQAEPDEEEQGPAPPGRTASSDAHEIPETHLPPLE